MFSLYHSIKVTVQFETKGNIAKRRLITIMDRSEVKL